MLLSSFPCMLNLFLFLSIVYIEWWSACKLSTSTLQCWVSSVTMCIINSKNFLDKHILKNTLESMWCYEATEPSNVLCWCHCFFFFLWCFLAAQMSLKFSLKRLYMCSFHKELTFCALQLPCYFHTDFWPLHLLIFGIIEAL